MSSIISEVMKRKTMMQKPGVVRPPFPSAVLYQAPLALTLNRTARGARFASTRHGNNTGEIKWDNMDRQRDTIQSGSQRDMKSQSQNLEKNMKIDQEINHQNMNITNMAQNEFKNVTNSGTKQSSSSFAEPRLTTTQNEINEKNKEGSILHDVKEAGKKTAKVVLDAAKEATEYVTGNKGYDEPEYLVEKGGIQGAQNLKESGKETAEMLAGHRGVTNGPSSGQGSFGGRKEQSEGGAFGGVGGGSSGNAVKQSDEMRGHERLGGERKQEPAAGMRMQGPQKMEGKIGGVEGEGNWGRPETHPNVPNDPYAQGTQGAKQEMEALRQKGSNMKEFDPQAATKEPLQSYLKEKAKETPDDTREVFEYQKGQRELNEDQVKVADYLKEEVGHKPPTEQPSNWSHNQNWNEDRNKKRIEQGDK